MKEHTYMIFNNKCGYCGCEYGKLSYKWAQFPPHSSGNPFAQTRGLKINFFECCACGMVTTYERVPVITGIHEIHELAGEQK